MKLSLTILPLLVISCSSFAQVSESSSYYQVTFSDKHQYNKAAISLHGQLIKSEPDFLRHFVLLSASEKQRLSLHSQQIEYISQTAPKIKLPAAKDNQQTSGISNYPCYPTVEETFTAAHQLRQNYPQLATMVDIGNSWQKSKGIGGYDLWVLKLTNQQTAEQHPDKPILFIHAAMHAREYTTSPLALAFAQQMVEQYQTNADYQWILDRHQIHILLHMNPDGRKQAEQQLYWRKNANSDYCQGNNIGADLNRNFSWNWGNVPGGSSDNPCNELYRGPEPASEPETQAVESYLRQIFDDNRGPLITDAAPDDTQGMHIDLHSYSELILWPWGGTTTPAPNGNALQTLGRKLAEFNDYYPQQSVGLYPTDGTSDNISYGELGIPNITFELGTAFFQSCSVYQNTILPKNLPALVYAAKAIEAPYLIPSGPDIDELHLNGQQRFSIAINQTATLTIQASDNLFNDINGEETIQNISAIALYINQSPWDDNAAAISLSPSDGSLIKTRNKLHMNSI